ncbi:MAG: hypothetical protein JWQ66_2911 [Mucilaginibacter sp.]|nr:hypothetical protein [Mucilaginibacter sp.]
MIPRKLKPCKTCGDPSYIFSHGNCKRCSQLAKIAEKREFKPLVQTDDGRPGKVFKVYQTTKIKSVSTRQQKLNAAYLVLRKEFMKANPICGAGLEGCTIQANECHHRRGRGEYLLDDSTYLALCANCHKFINEHNEFAFEMGFSESRLSRQQLNL